MSYSITPLLMTVTDLHKSLISSFSIYKIITYSVLIIPSTGRNSCNSTLHEFLLVNSAIAVTLNVGSKLTKLIHTQCRTSDEV